MSKHPNRRPISKNDMVRAIEGLVHHVQISSLRMEDIEKVLSDFIEFMDNEKKFGEYLDGKYKRDSDIGSGTDSPSSEE